MSTHKIPFIFAVLINLNIVIGGAFFLSSEHIVQKSGVFAPLLWLAVGLMLVPLSLALARLSEKYPVSGGLYHYTKELIGPFFGFLSGYGYFIGTAAGNALIIYAFRQGCTSSNLLTSTTTQFPPLLIDGIIIMLFAVSTFFNVEFLGFIQTLFTLLKTIPFLVVIIGAAKLFNPQNFIVNTLPFVHSLTCSVPIILFAYVGIEACCSIGHLIENGKKNTARVILVSLAIICAIYSIVQLLLIGIHGVNYSAPFTTIIPLLTTNQTIIFYGNLLIEYAILSSYLGGAYSMFYTNNWNLFTLANEKTIPFSRRFTALNRYQAPVLCIAAQALLIGGFLALTHENDILMTMSDFGVAITYLLSTCAFAVLAYQLTYRHKLLALCALGSSGYLLYICLDNLLKIGMSISIPYFCMIGVGILFYVLRKQLNSPMIA